MADRAAAAEREVSHKTDPCVAIEQSPVDMSDDSDSQVKLCPLADSTEIAIDRKNDNNLHHIRVQID